MKYRIRIGELRDEDGDRYPGFDEIFELEAIVENDDIAVIIAHIYETLGGSLKRNIVDSEMDTSVFDWSDDEM